MLSQILRFTLPSPETISSPRFTSLRDAAARAGAASQYFGYTTATSVSPLPRKRHEICWVVNWPPAAHDAPIGITMTIIKDLLALCPAATSLICQFDDAHWNGATTALESRVCEFAAIRLSAHAPLADETLRRSMHKTYTDAYQLRGFTGGAWSYACNTEDSDGAGGAGMLAGGIPNEERRLGIYYLGWESIELHEDATKEEAFLQELRTLGRWFGPGTGAWYATLRKHDAAD